MRRVAEIAGESHEINVMVPVKQALDRDSLAAYVTAAQARAALPGSAGWLCVAASMRGEDDALDERRELDSALRKLGWGVDDRTSVVMPHYDKTRSLAGAKMRAPVPRADGKYPKWSFPGSSFDNLYGCWMQGRLDSCLLTEGETDFAHAWYSDFGADVIGTPRGARSFRDEWIDDVAHYRQIFLALDPDDAGVGGSARWIETLGRRVPAMRVMVLNIPTGEDLRSCGIPVRDLMQGAELAS